MTKQSESWLTLVKTVANVEVALGMMLQDQHGLGLTEYRALAALAGSSKSELRMQELASHLQLNQSSISRMVERLERSGLTMRDVCPDDKRGVYAVLTEQGRARLVKAQPDYHTALAQCLAALDVEAAWLVNSLG
ncbi:MAG: MarR family transcriptional regulator [Neisseriaceae bacterium]|nr:MarR family transcriptional regulator [Neisseriaceae bacterium]